MDRRLIQAYDNMTMPDGCSRRIEAMLQEGGRAGEKQVYTRVLPQKPGRWTWVRAAALVCLVMVLAAGGVAVFLSTQGYSQVPVFEQPRETEAVRETVGQWQEDHFVYGEEGGAFLEKMCHVMPQWDGYASLDDVFWTEFTVRLLNDFAYVDSPEQSRRVTTPAGEALFFDGAVHMKRDILSAFIQEVMGCELPEFSPSGTYGDRISYRNDTYSAEVTEFPRLCYERQPSITKSERQVTYKIYREPDRAEIGQLTFNLRQEENDLGFIILGRPTTFRLMEIEEPEMETVAQAFAKAYFAYDIEGMKAHLSHRDDSSLILNPFVNHAYSGEGTFDGVKIFEVRIFATEAGERCVEAYVDYAIDQSVLYPSWSLVLDMVETEEGWKVRSFTDKTPESYDPDREEIFEAVNAYASDYLDGTITWAEDYWVGDRIEIPAYEGGAEDPRIQKITIYFDPLGETNDQGELMADAYVEIRESEQALNPRSLYLHLVKRGDSWLIDNIGEG